jgi:hypothetical protein
MRLCAEARQEIVLVAPFVKVGALRRLLEAVGEGVHVRCVTRWHPEEIDVGVSDAFAGAEMKRKQWDAFVRKGRLQTKQQSLEEVVSRIRLFLIEPAAAASQSESLEQRWPPGGPWEPVA